MGSILVLDKVADAARLVKRVLEAAGHEVFAFSKEIEALRFLEEHEVDLAILDPPLRQGNRQDALKTIRNRLPAMPVMILTGSPTIKTAREAKAMGVEYYHTKPMENEDLLETVTSLLEPGPGDL